MKYLTFLLILGFLSWSPLVLAQDINKGEPVEITADEAIEWVRDENLYRARGNAMAVQGGTSISADSISAFYDPKNTKTITEIHADGHVVIKSNGQKVVGDKGIYNIQTRIMRVTGTNLSVTTNQATVTAQESIEYNANQRKATARGNAVVSDGTNTIKAHSLNAWLTSNAQGKTVLKKVTAEGKIRIETPTDLILGDRGTYDAMAETATVEGNVQITRDQNQLNGDRAIVNLKTGVSQLLATPGGKQQRVRALFYPESDATPLGNN